MKSTQRYDGKGLLVSEPAPTQLVAEASRALAAEPRAGAGWWTLAIYTLTMFVSAALLFLVEPMFAKMALPLLGGSPAVWNTALVFYQVALLAGYVYAHASIALLGVRRQAMLHLALLLLPLLVLPIAIPHGWTPPVSSSPVLWLLGLLLVAVGLPFFVVATASPMLQSWFASSGHRTAADPYFLYAASNAGSLLALLAYPILLERGLRLAAQSRLWMYGYLLLILFEALCAVIIWRSPGPSPAAPGSAADAERLDAGQSNGDSRVTPGRRLRWVLLTAIPSSLMISVTTYMSTDLAAIPLLWIIPLSLYLLTFVIAFSQQTLVSKQHLRKALPLAIVPLVLTMTVQWKQPVLLIPLHLAAFFVAALVCHSAVARDRPSTRHLTEFYLWLSVGGAVGGLFTALLAPVLFKTVVEYPLVLVLLCLLQPGDRKPDQSHRSRWLDIALPLALLVLLVTILRGVPAVNRPLRSGSDLTVAFALFWVVAVVCYSFSRRPLRFGLAVAALLFSSTQFYRVDQGSVLYTARSFFGVNQVVVDQDHQFHKLFHGTTLHGEQSLDEAHRREPLSYYYPGGAITQVVEAVGSGPGQRVAVVGLGAGSMACYKQPGQVWTFYEIDPEVARIAGNSRYFSFLSDCAPDANIVLGDGRLSLARATNERYNMIFLDAYSSDAIPVHLLTREALALYLNRLTSDGVLMFNISNRHLDLRPVLANLAHDAGLVCLAQVDQPATTAEIAEGNMGSVWVVMARRPEDLGGLANDPRWDHLDLRPDVGVWTDDFSSILSVFDVSSLFR